MPDGDSLRVGLVYDDSMDRATGVSRYVATVGSWLTRHGHHVEYLVGQSDAVHDGVPVSSLARNVRVSCNGNALSMPGLPRTRRIRRVIRDGRFDVLHVQVPYSPLMAGRVVRAAGPDTALVGTFHINSELASARYGARALSLLCRPTLRRFDAHVAVSATAAAFACDWFGVAPTAIVPNPVELARFRGHERARNPDSPGDGLHVLFLGALVPRKGCRELLRVFAALRTTEPRAYLTIAGDGPLRPALERDARALGVIPRFAGRVTEAEKIALLASSDLAVFPSLYGESLGVVLVEAMAAGAGVVVGGDTAGHREVLEGVAQVLIDPRKVDDSVAALLALARNAPLRAEIHRWQQQLALKYDVEVVGRRLLDVYQSSLRARRSVAPRSPLEAPQPAFGV
jgi:phosphatidylinositol alpha-mannosyltransferase